MCGKKNRCFYPLFHELIYCQCLKIPLRKDYRIRYYVYLLCFIKYSSRECSLFSNKLPENWYMDMTLHCGSCYQPFDDQFLQFSYFVCVLWLPWWLLLLLHKSGSTLRKAGSSSLHDRNAAHNYMSLEEVRSRSSLR